MLIAFVIVLTVIGLSILFSIYSIFTPFVQSFGNIVDYNVAYYGAVSAIERGELVLKYRGPGFVGSGGRLGMTGYGKPSDIISGGFNISLSENNGMLWSIDSRTTRIPNIGEGNTQDDLIIDAYSDYNKLDYKGVETILLSIDNSSGDCYYNTGCLDSYILGYGGSNISGQFRLPPKIKLGFSGSVLCDDEATDLLGICDSSQNGLYNDIVIAWSLKGYYSGTQFSVMPNESVSYYGSKKEVQGGDTIIRESTINSGSKIIFGNSMNIFDTNSNSPATQNFISNDNTIVDKKFSDIFSSDDFTGLQLKFALVNLLRSFNNNIYPFLEYYFEFDNPVADRFYTIQGNGRRGDYDIKIIIKKPTFKETVAGSFTVVF